MNAWKVGGGLAVSAIAFGALVAQAMDLAGPETVLLEPEPEEGPLSGPGRLVPEVELDDLLEERDRVVTRAEQALSGPVR